MQSLTLCFPHQHWGPGKFYISGHDDASGHWNIETHFELLFWKALLTLCFPHQHWGPGKFYISGHDDASGHWSIEMCFELLFWKHCTIGELKKVWVSMIFVALSGAIIDTLLPAPALGTGKILHFGARRRVWPLKIWNELWFVVLEALDQGWLKKVWVAMNPVPRKQSFTLY